LEGTPKNTGFTYETTRNTRLGIIHHKVDS
jgi:hypothetical protein